MRYKLMCGYKRQRVINVMKSFGRHIAYCSNSNLYDDYFSALMAENYRKYPQYQRKDGDSLNWRIPGTEYHIPIFQSGFGDGLYPVWFGLDRSGRICSLVVRFIDIETEYAAEE